MRREIVYLNMSIDLLAAQDDIKEFITLLETTPSREFCSCTYAVHPADVEKPEGKRRVHIIAEDEWCPRHTKEGRLLGFLYWLKAGKPERSNDMVPEPIDIKPAEDPYGEGTPEPEHDMRMPHFDNCQEWQLKYCPPNCPKRQWRMHNRDFDPDMAYIRAGMREEAERRIKEVEQVITDQLPDGITAKFVDDGD